MNKVKNNSVILTLTLITSLLFFLQGSFNIVSIAKEKEEYNTGNVKITTNTKDSTSKDTEEIEFIVQENPNVAKGKLAPGGIAIATIELDLNGAIYPVDFKLNVAEDIPSNFQLTAYMDGEIYRIGETKLFNLDKEDKLRNSNAKIVILRLEWKDEENSNKSDTFIGSTNNFLSIPIKWEAKQHID